MSLLGQVMYYSNLSKKGREEQGGLEECQTLDWISMNSKEADEGEGGGGKKAEKKTYMTVERLIWIASCNTSPTF